MNFEALKERNERSNMARNDRDAGCYEALKERHPHERTAMPLEDRDARGWELVKVCGRLFWNYGRKGCLSAPYWADRWS